MKSFDAIVVGGGIIGASIAFRLAQCKVSTALLDAQTPGREASWAAAGILSPAPDSPDSIPLVPLGRASLALYPRFIEELSEITGLETGYRREGTLEVFFSPKAERELSTLIALHHGLGLAAEPVAVEEARRLEPALGREARAVALLPEEASVDNRALMAAVLSAAAAEGVQILPSAKVTALQIENGRCSGVIAGGRHIPAAHAVLAAGSFCSEIQGLAPPPGVKPVRGQMAALNHSGPALRRVLRSDHGYIVPRNDGIPQRLIVGSTLEDAGFDKRVTPQGLEKIFSAAQELAPALGGAEIVETWCGLRPDTPDHLPLLGPGEIEGLTFATGHYRNGILLTPITAKLVSEWITERRVSFNWERFSPLRFARANRPGAENSGRSEQNTAMGAAPPIPLP